MLSAWVIDGFGWFEDADDRLSWWIFYAVDVAQGDAEDHRFRRTENVGELGVRHPRAPQGVRQAHCPAVAVIGSRRAGSDRIVR